MNIRDSVISGIGLVTIYASFTFGYGGVPDAAGKPCAGCDCDGETQGGGGGDGGKDSSDPINLSTGDYQLAQTDLVIPGRGLDFKIHRFYRSYSGLQTVDLTDRTTNAPDTYYVNGMVTTGTYFGDDEYDDLNGPTPFGNHWDFSYNMRISQPPIEIDPGYVDADPHARIYDPIATEVYPEHFELMSGDGRIDTFESYDSAADPNLYNVLVGHYRHVEGTIAKKLLYRGRNRMISVLDANMVEYKFHPVNHNGGLHQYSGRLDSIVDRNGNTIQFHYELTDTNCVPRIDYAVDTLGNQINFVYHDETYNTETSPHGSSSELWKEHTVWIIADIVDGVNGTGTARREWRYEYSDAKPNQGGFFPILKEVTLPRIKDDSDFPMGSNAQHARFDQAGDRKWQFEYGDVTQWEHRLMSKITSPNGDVILENEYYGDAQDPGIPGGIVGRNSARVKHQHYGDGTYSYIASYVDPAENTDPDDSIEFLGTNDWNGDYYVWVNDRRGAITRFKYSGRDIGGIASGPFHRALLEKVEFEGFVPSAHLESVVWALVDASGNHTWYYLDSSNDPQPFAGPSGTDRYVKSWDWDSHWNPSQESQEWTYTPSTPVPLEQDSVTYLYDSASDDPLRWGAMLWREQIDSDGAGGISSSIREDWLYDFEFGGGTGGSGCGCSSRSFVTAYKDGNENVTLKEYDTSVNAVTGRANGNLLKIYHGIPNSTVTSANSANATAVEEFEYNVHGQVTKHIHSSTTTSTGSHEREDRFEYETDPTSLSYGRMIRKIVDYGGLNLTTDYLYDSVGNRIQTIDPGGDLTEYYYNQDSNLIKVEHFNSTATELFSRVEYFYDANGNVVQEEVANLVPHSGSPGGALIDADNPSFTTLYRYDEHDYLLQMAGEHGDMSKSAIDFTDTVNGKVDFDDLVTDDAHLAYEEWVYDEAKNMIKHVVGESANGSDPTVVHNEYDARDFLVRQYFGVDDLSILVDVEYDRDHKGRIEKVHVNPNDPVNIQTYIAEYDGFDRINGVIDPMGNTIGYEYDNNHNLTRTTLTGPYEQDTVASDTASSVVLLDKVMEYDARNRLEFEKTQVYDYSYGASTGISSTTELVTQYEYNDDNSIKTVSLPTSTGTPNITEYLYDTASRLVSMEDGDGNLVTYVYNSDSDVTSQTQTDVASDGSGTEQRFTTEYVYDVLHRVTKITQDPQNLALETLLAYDSRSNTVKQTDPRGNVTEFVYDGMSRQTQTKSLMTTSGDGTGSVLAGEKKNLVREAVFDDSGRVIAEIDDDGNTTSYTFDAMNRLLTTTMPDSAVYTNVYDANGNLSKHTDARGVVTDQLFDKNNRLASRSITYPSGFGNLSVFSDLSSLPTFETFEYDGAGRVRVAENDFTEVTREYDSLSNVVREVQYADASGSNRAVSYEFDAANNVREISSPNRSVYRSYDGLNRLSGIFNNYDSPTDVFSNPIIEFDYIGARVGTRSYGNGVTTEYAFTGYQDELNVNAPSAPDNFGVGRLASITSSNTSGVIDSHEFAWDKAQNRVRYDHTTSTVVDRRERSFAYDSSDRLIDSIVDFPDPLSSLAANTTTYTLDEVHNRVSVTESVADQGDAGAGVGTYTLNASAPSSNNQYLSAPKIGSLYDWVMVYDANGNLILQIEDVPGNYNQDGNVDFFDISTFLADHGNGNMDADINGDGSLDQFDVSAFLLEYGEGEALDVERRDFRYDHRNQLVDQHVSMGITELHTVHTYDPFARRLVESFDGDSDDIADSAVQFVYGCASLWEILERIDLGVGGGSEILLSTHVFGLGIDDEVAYRKEDVSPAVDVWSHRDDLNSLTSISDSSGDVLERFSYGDYGKVVVSDATGNAKATGSDYGAVHLYTGRVLMLGLDLYDYRYRVMSSDLGRFVQRDPLGNIDTLNIYIYATSSPLTFNDPKGLDILDWLPIVSTIKHAMESPYIPGNQPGHYFGCGGIASKTKCKKCKTQADKDVLQAQCEKCITGQMLSSMVSYAGGGITPDMAWGAIGAAIGAKATGKAAASGGLLLLDSLIDAGIQIDVLTDIYNAAKAAKGSVCHC